MKTIKVRHYSEVPKRFTGVVEYANGEKEWRLNGKRHRVDGPAVERSDGEKVWWLNGKFHRIDGPAIEFSDGKKQWWLNGKRHRTDGPAYEDADGSKVWYRNGKLHREDGPAYERADGGKAWWLNGRFIYCLDPIGDYIVVGDGLHFTIEWLGEWTTALKVLTATGFMYIPNLPGI